MRPMQDVALSELVADASEAAEAGPADSVYNESVYFLPATQSPPRPDTFFRRLEKKRAEEIRRLSQKPIIYFLRRQLD